jgi:hypothetical protein
MEVMYGVSTANKDWSECNDGLKEKLAMGNGTRHRKSRGVPSLTWPTSVSELAETRYPRQRTTSQHR